MNAKNDLKTAGDKLDTTSDSQLCSRVNSRITQTNCFGVLETLPTVPQTPQASDDNRGRTYHRGSTTSSSTITSKQIPSGGSEVKRGRSLRRSSSASPTCHRSHSPPESSRAVNKKGGVNDLFAMKISNIRDPYHSMQSTKRRAPSRSRSLSHPRDGGLRHRRRHDLGSGTGALCLATAPAIPLSTRSLAPGHGKRTFSGRDSSGEWKGDI